MLLRICPTFENPTAFISKTTIVVLIKEYDKKYLIACKC